MYCRGSEVDILPIVIVCCEREDVTDWIRIRNLEGMNWQGCRHCDTVVDGIVVLIRVSLRDHNAIAEPTQLWNNSFVLRCQ